MKKAFAVALGVLLVVAFAGFSFAAGKGKLDLKAGDQIYVCGCGAGCDCDTMSTKDGKCTCGKPLVKGTVTKVEKGRALIKTDKEEKYFKTTARYACACGKGCDCDTISQKPGKCACGKNLKKVKATKTKEKQEKKL